MSGAAHHEREVSAAAVIDHQGAGLAVHDKDVTRLLHSDDQRREQKRHRAQGRLSNLPKLGAENASDLAGSSAPLQPFARVSTWKRSRGR